MRVLCTAFLLMIFACELDAQKYADTLSPATMFARLNPLGLADVNNTNISVGVERKLSTPSSVALDVAYIFFSHRFRDEGKSRGFMLRPAYRFFPGKRYFFLEGELHYRLITHHLTDWVQRGVVDGVASYEQYTSFRLRNQEVGFHFKVGRQYYLSGRFWLELYLGVGFHYRKYFIANHPDWRYTLSGLFFDEFISTGETRARAVMPAGVRFLYRLSQ